MRGASGDGLPPYPQAASNITGKLFFYLSNALSQTATAINLATTNTRWDSALSQLFLAYVGREKGPVRRGQGVSFRVSLWRGCRGIRVEETSSYVPPFATEPLSPQSLFVCV